MFKKVTIDLGGRPLTIETGRLAKQANGTALVTYGETVVLVTATAAKDPKAEIDFLPLTVEYQERFYAVGRIPGSFFRREIGRPSDKETLSARFIDRPLRPLFVKGYQHETQVIATVLSADQENDPDVLAMIGASCALIVSDITFTPATGGDGSTVTDDSNAATGLASGGHRARLVPMFAQAVATSQRAVDKAAEATTRAAEAVVSAAAAAACAEDAEAPVGREPPAALTSARGTVSTKILHRSTPVPWCNCSSRVRICAAT